MTGPKLSRVDMDAVAPLMPHDKTAAMVSAKGEHYEFEGRPWHAHSSEPIAYRRPNAQELNCPEFIDLSGSRTGRFTVLGVAETLKTGDKANWVVRCVCGSYETRKARYLKKCLAGHNPGESEPMCSWCENTRRLQKGYGSSTKEKAWKEAVYGPESVKAEALFKKMEAAE